MSHEDYPDEIEIVETNFKTDQQSEAAETIAEEWPVDLDRLAEEGQHVKMFYKQVLEQFLGPVDADATFAHIKDEHGSLEQWAEGDDGGEEEEVEVPDVEDIEPGVGESNGTDASVGQMAESDGVGATAESSGGSADDGGSAVPANVDAAEVEGVAEDVDAQRRAWFRAGFREGVEFAVENPELFDR